MYIIKLDAIDSTNSYLKALSTSCLPQDFTVVVADQQTNGRGQMGTLWEAQKGLNLTASVFKSLTNFPINKQFYISMAVALALYKTLEAYKMPQLYVKWPNDILSANHKICGVLIENTIKLGQLKACIIGFGLNVNQTEFVNLPKASSMSNVLGKTIDKDELLSQLLKELSVRFKVLEEKKYQDIKEAYEACLYRKDKPSTFIEINNNLFTGIIKGVTDCGKLKVLTENNIISSYDLKAVTLKY